MNSLPSGEHQPGRSYEVGEPNEALKPTAVPVFNCLIYVTRLPSNEVRAQVVNLAGFECIEPSERQALTKLVAAFKAHIRDLVQSQAEIPWIELVRPLEPGEQQRYIAVHL
jgi:hypothetical protein